MSCSRLFIICIVYDEFLSSFILNLDTVNFFIFSQLLFIDLILEYLYLVVVVSSHIILVGGILYDEDILFCLSIPMHDFVFLL